MTKYRRIIHIDMDAFFASVEQRDNPNLRGKPIAVGGGHRGVVAAASYEARKFGVRSAMPSHQAKKLCPQIIFVKGSYSAYRKVSNEVMSILREYTDLIEQVSIDEAYIDVTDYKHEEMSAKEVAIEIRKKIKERVGLTASAGISFTKFLAKIASDSNKPDGYYVIHPNKADKFVRQLPVEKIPGVGSVSKQKLNKAGIYVGADIIERGKIKMALEFGKSGSYLYEILTFSKISPVRTHRLRKSVGQERTFDENISDPMIMLDKLKDISERLSRLLESKKLSGKTVTLKIKYHNFIIRTRSRTLDSFISSQSDIFLIISELLEKPNYPEEAVRLLGIQISHLNNVKNESNQLLLEL